MVRLTDQYEYLALLWGRKNWLSAKFINIWLLRSQNIVRSNNDSEINKSNYWRSGIGNSGNSPFSLQSQRIRNGFAPEAGVGKKRALTTKPSRR